MQENNGVAQTLLVIGIVEIIAGVICSFIYENILWVITSFVAGMLLIGFSEVIKILHDIRYDLRRTVAVAATKVESEVTNDDNSNHQLKDIDFSNQVEWKLDEYEKEKIEDKYDKKNIDKIILTPYEDYCIVKLNGTNDYKIVDIGDFVAREVKDIDMTNRIEAWYMYNG